MKVLWIGIPLGLIAGSLISNWIDYSVCSYRHKDCCYSFKSDAFRKPFYHSRGPNCIDQLNTAME